MEMPRPDIYDEGVFYWPYEATLQTALRSIWGCAPQGGSVLDVMCGSGLLLGQLAQDRPDLSLRGVDIDGLYVAYARAHKYGVEFEQGDILKWSPASRSDVVVCTGALHHIPYAQQERAVERMVCMAKPGGMVILADCYVGDYRTEMERQAVAATLGHQYLLYAIAKRAPQHVLKWTAQILQNDLLGEEFKTSLAKRMPILERHFASVENTPTWRDARLGCGESLHVCQCY